MRRNLFLLPILALAAAAFACAPVAIEDKLEAGVDNDKPLSDLDTILTGPDNDEIDPYEVGYDAALPEVYDELVAFNSPVRSQGRRGVCSIFSTTALMEHLYVLEGTITDPDFSEQYLQWSAKFEVGSFPNSSGSNAYYNLQAIHYYGIPAEEAWPYEINQWNSTDDPECDGEDDQPTRCYTNGSPPQEALDAQKYYLPRGGYLSTYDIKDYIANEGKGVVVGLTFFYQAWNHRLSELPTNDDFWRSGFVTYPNAEDKEFSQQPDMRAGHSILLLGWDDNLEVPVRDANGDLVMDDDGNVVREKGFYIFKNSWGTGSFGVNNANGDGYGYISYRYVREYGRARTADLPTNVPVPEGDTRTVIFEGDENMSIPDNDPAGITTNIDVPESGAIRGLKVNVDITHTWKGDLRVQLSRAGNMITLHDRAGGSADDLVQTFDVTAFDGTDMSGAWTLIVSDNAGYDTGTLNSWSLEIVTDDN